MNIPRQSCFPSRIRAYLLAIGCGVLVAILHTSAFANAICSNNLGPFYVDVPIDVIVALDVQSPLAGETFTINWGDGTSSHGTSTGHRPAPLGPVINTAGGLHTYSTAISGVSMSAQFQRGGGCVTNTFDVLADPPPGGAVLSDPTFVLSSATVGIPVPVTAILADFVDHDPISVASYFTAVIDWGDNAQSNGVLTRLPGTVFDTGPGTMWGVSAPPGGHTYTAAGSLTASVTFSERPPGTATLTATGVVVVTEPQTSPKPPTSPGSPTSPTSPAVFPTSFAVEYVYDSWNSYFVTDSPDEIAALDGGAYGGVWRRTGQTFSVWTDASGGALPTCRFFSTSFAPKSSHFYTPYASECATVKANPAWQYEGIAFYIKLPDANGLCAADEIPLYRLYNNGMGGAPNHRYTTSLTTVNQMLAAEWEFEGNGNTMVFACVPP